MSYLMKFQLLKSWRKMTKHLMNHSFLHRNHHQSPWCHWNYYGTSGTASRARTRSHAATSTAACGAWHAPSAWKSAMCLSGRNLWDDWDDGNLVALSWTSPSMGRHPIEWKYNVIYSNMIYTMGIYDYDIISNVICFLSGLGELQKLMLSNLIFHIKIAIWE